jgi:hypothetical protein
MIEQLTDRHARAIRPAPGGQSIGDPRLERQRALADHAHHERGRRDDFRQRREIEDRAQLRGPRARVVAQAAKGFTPDRSVGASDFDDGRRIRAGLKTRGDDEARRAHARGVGGKRRVAGHRLAQ